MLQTSKTQKKAAFRGILPQKTAILVTISGLEALIKLLKAF